MDKKTTFFDNKKKPFFIALVAVILVVVVILIWWFVKADGKLTKTSVDDSITKTVADEPNDVIRIISPEAGEELKPPFVIEGLANTANDVVTIFIQDDRGTLLFKEEVPVTGRTDDKFGSFSKTIEYLSAEPLSGNIILELSGRSLAVGGNIFAISLPLRINVAPEQVAQIFFANDDLNTNGECGKVFPTGRTFLNSDDSQQKVVDALLAGPNQQEIGQGFFSYLPTDVQLNKFIVEGGVAKIDFNQSFEAVLTDDCQAESVKQQIIETLKGLPEISGVVISIDGQILE